MTANAEIGFIGLGTMGLPMALNLLRAGNALVVWNRSQTGSSELGKAGARIATEAKAVFADCKTIVMMLANEMATDAVLARGTPDFAGRVGERRIVAMGTMPPEYSHALGEDIRAAGGSYVEAPVSGSRKPAEAGALVGMLAGEAADIAAVKPLLAPMCREIFECGAVPNALRMKLAVNTFLITMVTGLAEAMHFAAGHGLDLKRLVAILDAGPMASDVSKIKAAKLLAQDFTRQAGISDVLKNSRLVIEAARSAAISSPLMETSFALYNETDALGLGDEDMIAVIKAIEQRTTDNGQRTTRLQGEAD
ncbi:NAD(P)-dependent oxidoreductase [Brucella intermedia]|uniref:NAD(P)-dependent oxidoreductase n=1 Tax=Brucella intermedia TaxID=94625 RepID=UPI00224A90AE|nr:NAD(P)-dependent oxidoreductase [Brucella intermedia]